MAKHSVIRRFGSRHFMVWIIKHLISPMDRCVVRPSRGRLPPLSSMAVPTLLLTTLGRRSRRERMVPLVYVEGDDGYVVANARPAGEGANPWVSNLRAAGRGHIRVTGEVRPVLADELDDAERWWPQLVQVWPAFAEHYAATGERAVFALKPILD